MPNPSDTQNDDQFELELRQFRPLAPEPFPIQKINRPPSHRFAGILAIAAVAVVAVVLGWISPYRSRPATPAAGTEQLPNPQPLTLGRTNTLLARSPSYKAALDALAFQAQPSPVTQEKRSAIAELSKERIKL